MKEHGFPHRLAPIAGEGLVNVVVEAPAGSRNKYKFEPRYGAFVLHKVLPDGMVFPYDFGFVPGTGADDGDPIDILVLGDAPAFAGCVLTARLIGLIRARQTEAGGSSVENDRLIGILAQSADRERVRALSDLGIGLIELIEHFFTSYHALDRVEFTPLGRGGPDDAMAAVAASMTADAGHEQAG